MKQRDASKAPTSRRETAETDTFSDKAAALRLTPVSRETESRLDGYLDLLRTWQAKTNLVSPSTLPHLWTRHVADSLQLLALAPSAKSWVDLGSGGGFPGVVLACALAETSGAMVHLVERNAKKAAFLREALRVTSAPGMVHLADIGDIVDRIAEPRRLRHRAGGGSATSTHRLCGAAGGKRRKSVVSQRSRCRGRIDRSH